jgi:hypothetical protein
MIKGNIYVEQKRWPVSLRGNRFRCTNRIMRETLHHMPAIFSLHEGHKYIRDYEKALWDFTNTYLEGWARLNIKEYRRHPGNHVPNRIY